MDTKKLLIGTLIGGLVYFFGGWVIYDMILGEFFKAQAGSAQGVAREAPLLWSLALGSLTAGLLLTLIFNRWAGIKTAMSGAKSGALIGFLIALGFDFTQFGMTNLMTFTGLVGDAVTYAVLSGLAGAAIGWVLGRDDTAS